MRIRRRLAVAIVAAVFVPATAHAVPGAGDGTGATSSPSRSGARAFTVPFARVVVGDTLEIWRDGSRLGIGLIGMDAAQGNTRCGVKATRRLDHLVAGGITFEPQPGRRFDPRLRRMYYGFTPDGSSIAVRMVRLGLAYAVAEGREQRALAAAERLARREDRGCLWRGKRGAATEPVRIPSSISTGPDLTPHVSASTSAALLPTGFTEQVVASGLNLPTSFTELPNGRTLVAEKTGLVRVIKNGQVLSTPFIDIRTQVNDYWDRGLVGIAADPDFASNGYVYLYFTYENDASSYEGPKTARLIRVTATGDTASLSTQTVILGTTVGSSCNNFPAGTDCIPTDGPGHSTGDIEFASDGTMFVSVGDGAHWNAVVQDALRAQNLDLLAGKLLHVTTTGKGVPSNPFWNGNPDTNRSKVYAYGLRNSYRGGLRPGTNAPYFGDVGWGTREEINVATPGANLGWPCWEGTFKPAYQSQPTCVNLYAQGNSAVRFPLVEYSHSGVSAAATGGTFYTGTAFPSEYQGAYFYGDYARGWIKYIRVNASDGLVSGPTDLTTTAGAPVDIQEGPDGALYYISIYPGELRRICYGSCSASPGGDLQFASPVFYTVGAEPHSVAIADMNNDGLSDVVAGNSASNSVSVLRGNGNGTFAPQASFGAGGRVKLANVGDFDEDGKLDVVTANESTSTISLLRGNGDGTLSTYVNFSVCNAPHDVAVGDLNADGHGDVVASCWGDDRITVRLGTGTGTFGSPTHYAAGINPLSAAVADVNGDGKADVITANHGENNVSVFIGNGDGTLGTPVKHATGAMPHEVRARDLNGDGRRDLITANDGSDNVSVLLGTGAGSFQAPTTYAAGEAPMSVVVADLNGDAALDLAVADSGGYPTVTGPSSVGVFLGKGDGTFDPIKTFPSGTNPFSIAAGDLNGDGLADLAAANFLGGSTVAVLLNQTSPGPPPPPPSVGYPGEVLADQPLGYWRLGESSGTTAADASGNNRPGTFVGGPTLGSPGLQSSDADTSITVNGLTQRVEVPHAAVWNLTGDLTIEALVNVTGGDNYRTIVAKHDATGDIPTFELRIQTSNNKLQFVQKTTAGTFLSITGNTTLATGTTYHVAVTKSGNTVTLYVNGAVDKTQTFSGTIATNTRPVTFGRRDGSKALAGRIDEVAIYGAALTSSRIAAHYAAVTTPGQNAPPTPTISSPTSSTTFAVGDVIGYSGSATDPEDGAIPASGLSWEIRLHHCIGTSCHIHPYLQTTGSSGSFTIPDHGGEGFFFELILKATDSDGAMTSTSVSIQPRTTPITIDTSPAGLDVFFGERSGTSPLAIDAIVGSSTTISAPNQGVWLFDHWSDGGAQTHSITVGTSPVTYTAFFVQGQTGAYPGEVLADQPLGYWRLGESSGTTAADASGNNRPGTFVGGPTLGSPGLQSSDADTSITVNGLTQRVEVPHAAVWNLTGNLTIEALVNVTGGDNYRTIVAKHDATGDIPTFELRIQTSNNKLQFVQKTTAGTFLSITGNTTLATGTTYHVAVTKSGNTVTLYVNGAVDKTQTFSGTIATNTRPVTFGRRDGSKALAGRIDEVAIYGAALTSSRIAAHYAAA